MVVAVTNHPWEKTEKCDVCERSVSEQVAQMYDGERGCIWCHESEDGETA